MQRKIILSFITLLCTLTYASAERYFADHSALASGRWVKLHIDSTGIYRLGADKLRQLGFKDMSRVSIAGYGSVERAHTLSSAPDDLPAVPVIRTSDAIYFYGEGDSRIIPSVNYSTDKRSCLTEHRNFYSSGSYYFITDSEALSSEEPTTITFGDLGNISSSQINTHYSLSLQRREDRKLNHTGVYNFSYHISEASPLVIPFRHPDATGWARLSYIYAHAHDKAPESYAAAVNIRGAKEILNFTPVPYRRTNYENWAYRASDGDALTLQLDPSADRIDFEISNPQDIFSLLSLEHAGFIYERKNSALASPHIMHIPGSSANSAFNIPDGTLNLIALDVTDTRAIKRLMPATNDIGVKIPMKQHAAMARLIMFTPSRSIPTPKIVGDVPNTDLHSLHDVDLLIVTTDFARPAAERLAQAHREYQNLSVAVATQSEIYNEFSSGALHPNAIRHLVAKLSADTDRPLRYLLLFGIGHDDTRRVFSDDNFEYLATYYSESLEEARLNSKNYSTDQYFGFIDEDIQPVLSRRNLTLKVAVGRIPARGTDEANLLADKCIRYLQNPELAGDPSQALFIAGTGENNSHIKNLEKMASAVETLIPGANIIRGHHAIFKPDNRQRISASMQAFMPIAFSQQSRYINYSGHGSPNALAHNNITVPMARNYAFHSMPFTVLASCYTTHNDLNRRVIGNEFFYDPNGPIAVVGSAKSVYMGANQTFNDSLTTAFFTSTPEQCLGDIMRIAHNNTSRHGEAQRANNFCYNFIGDPALPTYAINAQSVLTHIDDRTLLTGDTLSVSPLIPHTLHGEIHRNGTIDTEFNGTINIKVYDAPYTTNTYTHVTGDTIIPIRLDQDLLSDTRVAVKNGKWQATFSTPEPTHAGANRISMWAWSDDRSTTAFGATRQLRFDEPANSVIDSESPIISITPNPDDILADGTLAPSARIHIEVTDPQSGVILSKTGAFSNAPVVTIDSRASGAMQNRFVRADSNSASADLTLPSLFPGTHTLSVSAVDVAGNTSHEAFTFRTSSASAPLILQADQTIARQEILLSIPGADSPRATLIIRNSAGSTVARIPDATLPYTWDFRSSDGSPLPDDTYSAYAVMHEYLKSTPTTQVQFTYVKQND